MNYFAAAFCGLAIVAVAGADYYSQANSNGPNVGGYSVVDHLQSYGDRVTEYRADQAKAKRQSELAKVHLPEAPDGWDRLAWEPTPPSADGNVRDGMGTEEQAAVAAMQNSLVGQMAMKDAIKTARRIAQNEVWLYVKGDTSVLLRAAYKDPVEKVSFQDQMVQIALNNMMAVTTQLDGFAVIQGVPFFKVTEAWSDMDEVAPLDSEINLVAQLGADIELSVKSNASARELRALLDMIDYDALNLMLDKPLNYVGSTAPKLSLEQEVLIAARAAEVYRMMQFTDSVELQTILADGLGATAHVKETDRPFWELLQEHASLNPEQTAQLAKVAALAAGDAMPNAETTTAPKVKAKAPKAQAKQTVTKTSGEKPRLLQLQSQTKRKTKNCVGSFCD